MEGIAALWVPETGIIDFVGVTNKLADLIKEINPKSDIKTSCEVKHFQRGEVTFYLLLRVVFMRKLVFVEGFILIDWQKKIM